MWKRIIIKVIIIVSSLCLCYFLLLYLACHLVSRPLIGICGSQMKQLSVCLLIYAEDHGRFPDSEHWIEDLRKSGKHPFVFTDKELKCPEDKTSSRISYEMNSALSDKRLADIPEKSKAHIVLLREKIFPGSHAFVCYVKHSYPVRQK